MESIVRIKKWNDKATRVIITLSCALILCACQDDGDVSVPGVPDFDWNDVDGAVYVNDEYIKDATARFAAIPGTDSTAIVLSGVHPTEEIEVKMSTARDKDGNISFKGEQTVENVRNLSVAGKYMPYGSSYGQMPLVRVVVTYTVTNDIAAKEIAIPIDGNSGFRFYYSTYCHPSKSEIDSCQFIIGRINSELGRHLKTMSFKFTSDGQMTFSYTNSKSVESRQTFRYWIEEKDLPLRTVVNIDGPGLFYEYLLNALTPAENRIIGDLLHFDSQEIVRIQIDESDNQNEGIVILGDLHYKIFPYLYTTLLTDNVWSDMEKDCFGAIERAAKFSIKNNESVFNSYTWVFGNLSN